MPLRTLIELPKRLPRSGNMDFMTLWSKGSPDADVTSILDHWWRQDRRLMNDPMKQNRQPATLNVEFNPPESETAEPETPAVPSQPASVLRIPPYRT